MSMFRKPKRNVRQRQLDSDDENGGKNEEDESVTEIQSTIEKLKGTKKGSKKHKNQSANSNQDASEKKSSLLSFDDFDAEADDGEVFRVKKSSQSRRLMKQIKAERKLREKQDFSNDLPAAVPPPPPLPTTPMPPPPPSISTQPDLEEDIGIKLKSNLVINKLPDPVETQPRTLTGYEAEALHMEDEDLSDEDDEENGDKKKEAKDSLQEILDRGEIPDATAIFAARKKRQAAREKGGNTADVSSKAHSGFIGLRNNEDEISKSRNHDQDDDSDNDEERTIVMTGTRSDFDIKRESFKNANEYAGQGDDHYRWEEQQIRKVVKKGSSELRSLSPEDHNIPSTPYPSSPLSTNGGLIHNPPPASYNLPGIRDRIKARIENLTETYRAHCNEADKIVDEVILSQTTVEEKEKKLPATIRRHHFYQDLRGYLTDLVECFDEKLTQIRFVQDKYHKTKSDVQKKLLDRRREDVRDQMRELSKISSKPILNTAEENNEEWARQRRAAEREGRRRRRAQMRTSKMGQIAPHNDGMSSDDELPSLDQANIAQSRSEVENQARTIMSDVVEDFCSLNGVLSRMEEWKITDNTAYNEAYVSLCLHKMIAPLVTLQLLFWNPLEEHSNIEDMEWYAHVIMYSNKIEEVDDEAIKKDDDNMFLSYVMEKVVMVKINDMVKAAYDPLSSSQTLRLSQLIHKLKNTYSTLTGSSKQVRDLLTSVIEKFKSAIDHDVYIPLGYSKQALENPLSGHSVFLHRQFWSCFKLFKNVLCWHGLIADKILMDLSLSSLLYRYLLIGLGVTQNPVDCVFRSRQIVQAFPDEWKQGFRNNPEKMKNIIDLDRFTKYLITLGHTPSGMPRESVKEVVQLLKVLGATNEADSLEKKVLHNV